MRIYGGLRPEDWTHWGQFTTLKTNAAGLLARSGHARQIIYCSPLVDPYQPAERERPLMPAILTAFLKRPPAILAIQTRGPLILRDLDLICALAAKTTVRVSFSVTTNRDEVRSRYEPHCEPNSERLHAVKELRQAGIEVYATLAPLLPCDPETLACAALDASHRELIGDPLHVRATKAHGATTREAARKVAARYHEERWFHPQFQAEVVSRIGQVTRAAGFAFLTGPKGFGRLARHNH